MSSSLWSVVHGLTISPATAAYNKQAKVSQTSSSSVFTGLYSHFLLLSFRSQQNVAQSRTRSDSMIAIPCDHIHTSVSRNIASVVPEPVEATVATKCVAMSYFVPSSSSSSDKGSVYTLSSSPSSSSISTGACNTPIIPSDEVESLFDQSYRLEKILGRGASAEVYLARSIEKEGGKQGQQYACKAIHRNGRMNDTRSMQTEVMIMKKLHHPNVIQLHELYETDEHIWMIEELATEGELLRVLDTIPKYTEQQVSELFKQILLAIKYLHSKGIVHRDLKMDNLLVSRRQSLSSSSTCENEKKLKAEDYLVKVSDFGLSALTIKRDITVSSPSVSPSSSSKDSSTCVSCNSNTTTESSSSSGVIDPIKRKQCKQLSVLTEMWGTSEYFAPEVYQRHGYGFQADIWSLGCLLYEMLTGELAFPYRERSISVADRLFFHNGGGIIPGTTKPKRSFEMTRNWSVLSTSAKSLIKKMLKRNPIDRFDIDECLAHPWIASPEKLSDSDMVMNTELTLASQEIHNRCMRKQKRYEALVKEVEREKAVQDVLKTLK